LNAENAITADTADIANDLDAGQFFFKDAFVMNNASDLLLKTNTGVGWKSSGTISRSDIPNVWLENNGTSAVSVLTGVGITYGSLYAENVIANGRVSATGDLLINGTKVDLPNLPTSDPGIPGRVWRSGTDLKISV
jgi:hypothetical protein